LKLLNHAQLNEQLVHLQITDVTDGTNPVAVFNNGGSDMATSLRSEKTMSVFGRQWRIVAWPAPAMSTAFQGAQIQIAQFLLFELCLTLVCVTAFLVVRTQRLKSDSISQMADNKASEEKRWKDMADRLPQLVWTCTPEGHCDYLSARWQQFTGIDSDKQLGDKWLQQIHPDDRPALLKDWATAVAERSSFCAEFRIRRFDGEYIWFDTRATPVFDHNGQLSRWVGSNTDIHAQHEAQQEVRTLNLHLEELVALRTQALTESKRKVQLILDTVPSLIGYWTVDLINVFANHAYEDWFGRKPKSLPGTHLSGLLPIEVYQNTLPKIKRVLAGERMTFLNKFPDLNGNGERFGLVSMLPDLVEGEVVGFFVSMQDVTEIQKAREAAMASSSAKSKFLATVGHEIRNPLNNILGSTIILSEEVDNPDVLESLEGIRESAHSIRVILDDLLDLSAFESGRLNIEHVEFDLSQCVRQATQLYDGLCRNKGVAFHLDTTWGTAPMAIKGDPTRLKQIVQNLVSNAVKFTNHGEVHCTFALVNQSQKCVLRLKVRDTGCGIANDRIGELFTPFVQANSSTYREYGGSGLGLSITKSLVDVMGGTIRVSSQLGEGSLFTVEIPVDQVQRVAPPLQTLPAEVKLDEERVPPLEVLVVDDAKTNRRILKRMLEKSGHHVEDTECAVLALEMCRHTAFDLIVTDLNMPDMDGYQLAEHLRHGTSPNKHTAIIALSGCVSDAEKLRAKQAGIDQHLAKPLDVDELKAAIKAMLAAQPASTPPNHEILEKLSEQLST